jgi:hypothetical protein
MTNQGALNLIRTLERRGWLELLGRLGRGGSAYWYAPEVLGLFDETPSGSRSGQDG